MIRADLTLVPDPIADLGEAVPAPLRRSARTSRTSAKAQERKPFRRRPRSRPGRGRAAGQGGRSAVRRRRRPRAARRLLRPTRPPPARCARALRCRAPPPRPRSSASTPTKAALRDLRFAVGDALGPAAKLLGLWRDLAGRPPSLDPSRISDAAARLDLAVDPNGLAASLKARAGEGDPVSAAAKAAALVFSAFPDAQTAAAEILALWVFDIALALRLRWPRPLPLIATDILDPSMRSDGGGAAKARRSCLAEGRGRRDRPRRRLRPRPCRRSLPPLRGPDRRRAQTARQTGRQNRRPAARPRLRLTGRSGPPGADDRPRRPPPVRPARCAWRRARTHRPARVPAVRPVSAAARRRNGTETKASTSSSPTCPQPPAGANGCSGSKRRSSPPHDPCRARRWSASSARDCRFDDLIADLIHELRGRPYDLALVAGGYALRTKTRFAPAIRAAHPAGQGTRLRI